MRFNRVKSSLAVLENAEDVTICDALNVFYDLCEDLRQEKGTIDQLPDGSEALMVRRMCWAGRTLLRIAEKHPDYIQKSEKSQNWEKTCADILREDQRIGRHLQELSDHLEECRQAYEEKQYREHAICLQIENLQSESEMLEKEAADKENDYIAMNEAFETQKALYEQLIIQMQKLSGEHKKLVADTNALEEKLKIVNVEELREIYKRKSEELELLRNDCETMELQLKAQSEEAQHLKEELAQHAKYLQEQAWNMEAEKQKVQSELDALEERIARAVQERSNLTEGIKIREKELKELENWFDSLEAQEYSARMQKCYQRTMRLKASQDMLTKELRILGAIADDQARDRLIDYQQYFRDAMEHIEQTLDEYQKNYLIVTETFGQGGSGL